MSTDIHINRTRIGMIQKSLHLQMATRKKGWSKQRKGEQKNEKTHISHMIRLRWMTPVDCCCCHCSFFCHVLEISSICGLWSADKYGEKKRTETQPAKFCVWNKLYGFDPHLNFGTFHVTVVADVIVVFVKNVLLLVFHASGNGIHLVFFFLLFQAQQIKLRILKPLFALQNFTFTQCTFNKI